MASTSSVRNITWQLGKASRVRSTLAAKRNTLQPYS
ncbi:Uncharacterised protein [Vibrio cholerae]|nr:Uncharacterised protein [Vibrio cholerae]